MSLFKESDLKFKQIFANIIDSDESDDEQPAQSQPTEPSDTDSAKPEQHEEKPNLQDLRVDKDHAVERIDCQSAGEIITILSDDEDHDSDDDILILEPPKPVKLINRAKKTGKPILISESLQSASKLDGLKEIMSESISDEDYNLHIMLPGDIYRKIPVTYGIRLKDALSELISEAAARDRSLVVTDDDSGERLDLDETPKSLGFTPGKILNVIEVQNLSKEQSDKEEPDVVDPDVIRLKLQDGHRKHVREFNINKSDPLMNLKGMWIQEFDLGDAQIKLSFDGEIISEDATPEDLDMEAGDVVDVIVSSN